MIEDPRVTGPGRVVVHRSAYALLDEIERMLAEDFHVRSDEAARLAPAVAGLCDTFGHGLESACRICTSVLVDGAFDDRGRP